jgi:hypothetical protein
MTARTVGAVIVLVAAALLLGGTFSQQWLAAPAPHDGGVGLTGFELCRTDQRSGEVRCESRSWSDLAERPGGGRVDRDLERIRVASMAAVAGSIVVSFLFGVVGILALATRRRVGVATVLAIIAAALALVGATGTTLILRKYYAPEHLTLGYSLFLYVGGCVAGVVGSVVARRQR